MLRTVVASRFIRKMGTGRNLPSLLSCDDCEIVAKFSGAECGQNGLAREALAAMLAADLGLPVPEPVLVELIEGFVESLPVEEGQLKALIGRSVVPGFGSVRLPSGFSVWAPGRRVEDNLVVQATEIFAFDALVLNSDRRAENPNCQSDGSSFAIFDHEMALMSIGIGTVLNPAPWQPGGLSSLTHGLGEHVLYRSLHRRSGDLGRLERAWGAISVERFEEYASAIPRSWVDARENVAEAIHYLRELLDRLSDAFLEVRRALA